MSLPFTPAFPWLLYAYPWMPFPRRVIIYLREKRIPSSLVTVVRVSTPQDEDQAVDSSYPPRPTGSLPILVVPSAEENGSASGLQIRQSMAIMHFLEEVCEKRVYGFGDAALRSLAGTTLVQRVEINEVLSLAEQCTGDWNPVRTFGTKAGTMSYPAGSKEMLRWVRRSLMTIEKWWQAAERDMSLLRQGVDGHVTLADIVLYQFLEFTRDCYGVDMTLGSGEKVRDVYGREVVETFPKLREFFEAFGTRESARRIVDEGDVPPEWALKNMLVWADGAL
ncbi:hypothetical protein BDY17DRAFT_325134 [Neohortaea acidophila]|uniref:GST N-terminal domain-containing protein n=1 Tax=Neohortaea acidophila TaxID=245834 RepID=A0A6A6PNC6_9PEZI|nr:uncharacterized protein BDY17DRAFT_325134 [Neohortaea acidophila]KAF2481610.1 hypothetical protein BDY17DRAFT_325134 [Neohortaea acidophila]